MRFLAFLRCALPAAASSADVSAAAATAPQRCALACGATPRSSAIVDMGQTSTHYVHIVMVSVFQR